MTHDTTHDTHPFSADGGARNNVAAVEAVPRPERTSRALPDDALIIVPVRNVVLFRGLVMPLSVGRERSVAAAQEAVRLERPLGILLQTKPDVDRLPPGWRGTGATSSSMRHRCLGSGTSGIATRIRSTCC